MNPGVPSNDFDGYLNDDGLTVSALNYVWVLATLEWVPDDGSITIDPGTIVIGTVLQGDGDPAAVAWKVDGSGVTQPVSGTVAVTSATFATQATLASALTELQNILAKLNASIAVTAASLPLPLDAATQTTLAALNAKIPAQVDSRVPTTTGVNYGASLDIANDPMYPMAGITPGFTWAGIAIFDTPLVGTEFGVAVRFAGTQDVDIKANTIGLATGVKQDTGNTSLGSIDTKLTSQATAANQATEITALGTLNTSVNTLLTDTELRATPVPVSGTVDIGSMPPVSAETTATAVEIDADAAYTEDVANPLTQTLEGFLRTLAAGVVTDVPPSYVPGQLRPFSLSTEGRIRVSSVEAKIDMEFFDSDNLGSIPNLTQQQSLWNPSAAPLDI